MSAIIDALINQRIDEERKLNKLYENQTTISITMVKIEEVQAEALRIKNNFTSGVEREIDTEWKAHKKQTFINDNYSNSVLEFEKYIRGINDTYAFLEAEKQRIATEIGNTINNINSINGRISAQQAAEAEEARLAAYYASLNNKRGK